MTAAYETLAAVYDFLVPEPLREPEGSAAAFAGVLAGLTPGARVLDCAAGTGTLAVGLALRGFDVVASDASEAMVARIRALAAARGVHVPAFACRWEELGDRPWARECDAVLCVGNSLTHAPGPAARRAALAAMTAALRPGGLLAVTSRNWERVRAGGSGLRFEEALVERAGRRALVVRAWTIAEDWDEPHALDVGVAVVEADGRVVPHAERLAFWPFRHEALDAELRAAGLTPASSTYAPDADRYLVTARAPR